jgi:hypothetical protein
MGRASRSKCQRGYLTKLFGGRTTAQDVWRTYVIGSNLCNRCKAPAIMEGHLFWPVEDFERDHPALAVKIASEHNGGIPFVSFKSAGRVRRDFVHLPTLYSCGNCAREFESMLAKAPSYVVVEVRKGPGADKIVSAVPS